MAKPPRQPAPTPSAVAASTRISEKIARLGDWRGGVLDTVRRLIHDAAPDVVEEWKWMGTPVWSRDGIVCTGETYKDKVKLTFATGASLADPTGLLNASLDGNVRRAIDIREGDALESSAFIALVQDAVAINRARKRVS